MFKEKYPNTFPNGGYCFYYSSTLLQRSFSVLAGEYINNSLHLARKYARIFVRRHYLFRVANSFPRA